MVYKSTASSGFTSPKISIACQQCGKTRFEKKKTIRNCLNRQKKKRKGKTSSLANCRGFFQAGHFAARRKVERQGCIFHFSFFEVPIFFWQTISGVGNVERKPFSSFSDFPLKWQKNVENYAKKNAKKPLCF